MIITTRNLKEPKATEPKKLNYISTGALPDAPAVPAPVKGDGFAKMITTHDEPKPAAEAQAEEKKPAGKAKKSE